MVTRRRGLWLLLPAGLGVAVTYADSLHLGLWWDDYQWLRPWTWSQLAAAFHGSWEPDAVFQVYYRPLTTAYVALAFHLFGLNAWAHHLVSIVELLLCAWMTALFVQRETGLGSWAAIAALLYGVHPAVAHADGPWFFQQSHLLGSLIVLLALMHWQRCRARPSVRTWWPVGALTVVGFLIREDGLMLAPALVMLQAARARVLGDVPRPTRALVVGTALLVAGLVGLRFMLLGEIGGEGPRVFSDLVMNVVRLCVRVLFVFQRQHLAVNAVASIVSTGWLVWGAWLVRRWMTGHDPRPASLPAIVKVGLTGATLFGVFALPLVFLSSPARYHVLALGAVLMLSAGLGAIATVLQPRLGRIGWAASVAMALVSFALAGRAVLAPFRSCAPERLETDGDVLTWLSVPAETRQWIAATPAACLAGTHQPLTDSLSAVTWPSSDASASPVVLLVRLASNGAAVTLRDAGASAASPVSIVVIVDGVESSRVQLTAPGWQTVTLRWSGSIAPALRARLRQMHRIDLSAEPLAPFRPITLEVGRVGLAPVHD